MSKDAFEPIPTQPAQDELPELVAWLNAVMSAQHIDLAVRQTPAKYAAKPFTLYLDTNIPSYLTARTSRDVLTAGRQLITRRWWHEHRARHVIYISDLVVEEAGAGDSDAARRRMDAIAGMARLLRSAQSYELAGRILTQCRLPARVAFDAHHVAIAALNGVQALLTWNCKHLANANIIPVIRRVCEAHGCAAPAIYTPDQLIGVCAYGRSDS